MKRSNAPIYWSLFGAGGMLAALVAPGVVLVLLLCGLGYPQVHAFATSLIGKAFLFAVASLFLWHAAHRIFHTVHDVGIHPGVGTWILCYGVALAGTLSAAVSLLRIGF
jgi:fumarate reductase subunit D